MARALSQIIKELNSVYAPQRDLYNKQISGLDPQLSAEHQGLEAQKEDSFRQITDQANRRGMFYSGLPVAEQQRYTGTQFLPAVANLRAKYSAQRFGLQDAIAKITAEQYNTAYGVRQKELEIDEQRREFDRRMAAEERARRAAAASGGGGGGGYTFEGTPPPQNNGPSASTRAYREVQAFLGKGDRAARSDMMATAESARRGNAYDKLKMQVYRRAGLTGWSYQNRGSSTRGIPSF